MNKFSKQKIYFITYGTKDFDIAAKHLIRLGEKSELFDKCIYFKPKDLSARFKGRYEEIFNLQRGGGYWIWKHEIIKQTLDQVNENDIVVYCDSGSSFNINGKGRFNDYLEMLNSSEFGNFRIECEKENIEKHWTSKEIFNYFKVPMGSKVTESTQLEATEIIFKKTNHTQEYLESYKDVLNYDPFLITDKYNNHKQIDGFKENRHDQSIFSVLSKVLGCVSIPNETHFKGKESEQFNYPFLAVRTYGHGYKDKLKYLINYKKKYDIPVFFK